MAHRSHVPQFGNWESEENVPYTVFFDKARKGRGGTKMVNPNDPEENPDSLSDIPASRGYQPPNPRAEPVEPIKQATVGLGSTHERRRSRDDAGLRTVREATNQRLRERGEISDDNNRRSARAEYTVERSPFNRNARVSGRESPLDSNHGTPARTRMRPTRGDETADRGAAVPKFGGWDVNNPESGDGYTRIFNKVREERQTGPGRVPGMPTPQHHANAPKQGANDNVKASCFPWCK